MAKLVIVESPAKAKTIGKYLGKDYEVTASMGHIRDLPASQLGIDIEHDYAPQYISIKGKEKLIKELKSKAKHSDGVLLATDPDREGEAISWHLANILGLDPHEPNRVTFDEITKKGVKEGMAHPRAINEDLFNAQQARRVLDRLVGYKLSPFLWRKVRPADRPREGDRSLQARGILERGRYSGCGPEELHGPSGLRRQGKKAPAAL